MRSIMRSLICVVAGLLLWIIAILLLLSVYAHAQTLPNNLYTSIGKSFNDHAYFSAGLYTEATPHNLYGFCELTTLGNGVYLSGGMGYAFGKWSIGSAVGKYWKCGMGPDLGSSTEFCSFVEYRTGWLGFGVAHISNAGLGEYNPGMNIARVTINY